MPRHAGEHRVLLDANFFENELARDARAQAHFAVHEARLKAAGVGRHEEPMNFSVGPAELCPHKRDLRDVAVGDPALRPTDHVGVPVVDRDRAPIPLGFEPKSGSVRPKHPMISPLAILGRYFCFCSSEPNV